MKIAKFNDFLALVYLVFIIVWILIALWAVRFSGMSAVEALGLGTATGVLLAILKDVFQFYFRTNKPNDQGGPS